MTLDVAANVFKEQFAGYQAILTGDYLQHSVLYSALDTELLKLPVLQSKPQLSLLDLGCGDAVPLCNLLVAHGRHQLLAEYTGVDMSAPALSLAKFNLNSLPGPARRLHFCESDMLSFLRSPQCQTQYDVVLASFSIHHLQPMEKQELLHELHKVLHPRGALIMIDVLRFPDESVAGYRKRICDDARDNWLLMPPLERATFIEHMQKYDFPETFASFQAMACKAGFESVDNRCTGSKALGNLIVVQNDAASQ